MSGVALRDARGARRGATRRAIVRSSALLVIAAVACERSDGAPQPPAAISAKLTIWGNPTFPFDRDVGGEIVSSLRAKYPNVSVTFAPENDSLATKLIAAAAGGVPPDLDSTSGFMAQTLGYKGLVLALDSYLKRGRGIKRDDIWPSLLNEMTWKGNTYGLPYAPDVRLIYAGKNPYQRAGLDYTHPPKTWDEMLEVAKKTTRTEGGELVTVGFDPYLSSSNTNAWLLPFWQAGGELTNKEGTKVTLATEPAIKALTWIQQVIDAQGGWQVLKVPRAKNLYQRFVDGQAAHLVDTFSIRSESLWPLDKSIMFGYAPYPLPAGGRRANLGGNHTFFIPKESKQHDAAWLFLQELYDEPNLLKFVDRYDRVPATQSLSKSDKFLRNDPFRKLMIEEMPGRRWFIPLPGAADLRQPITDLPTQILEKNVSIREALTQAQAAVQAALDLALRAL
jgi:multiple sugar transport system substrate-binding protein